MPYSTIGNHGSIIFSIFIFGSSSLICKMQKIIIVVYCNLGIMGGPSKNMNYRVRRVIMSEFFSSNIQKWFWTRYLVWSIIIKIFIGGYGDRSRYLHVQILSPAYETTGSAGFPCKLWTTFRHNKTDVFIDAKSKSLRWYSCRETVKTAICSNVVHHIT